MYEIHYTLYSLLNQTVKPDEVVLWLAKEQFPNGNDDIPPAVLDLQKNGLTIKWCEDLRSYKKLIPSLKEYPVSVRNRCRKRETLNPLTSAACFAIIQS